VYSGSTLLATTLSDTQGQYQVLGVPPGTGYTVIGEATVEGTEYSDVRTGISVLSGANTPNVNLFLLP
jgi:hypothetical protein